MKTNWHEDWARVVLHLNDGYTQVEITDEAGQRLYMTPFDIPTKVIPVDLRPLGSRFRLRWAGNWPETSDTVEEMREKLAHSFEVLTEQATDL